MIHRLFSYFPTGSATYLRATTIIELHKNV